MEKETKVVEAIVEIASKYNDGEFLSSIIVNGGLTKKKKEIEDIAIRKGVKIKDSYTNNNFSNQEVEDAIDLYIELIDEDDASLVKGYIWSLCLPLITSVYERKYLGMAKNLRNNENEENFRYEFLNTSYIHFEKLLREHTANLINDKLKGKKGCFKMLLNLRLNADIVEELIKNEYASAGIYKTKSQREFLKKISEFAMLYGHIPNDSELSEFINMSIEAVRKKRAELNKYEAMYELDTLNSDVEMNPIECGVVDKKLVEGLIYHDKLNDENAITKIIENVLDEKQRRVVNLIYGFDGLKTTYSVPEVACMLDLSPYKVRQINKAALEILKPYIEVYLEKKLA